MQFPDEPAFILGGSFIVFSCVGGYTNVGGNLNVTCGINNHWSPFPRCVSSNGGGVGTMTIMGTLLTGSLACFIDRTTTFSITNGFLLNSTINRTSYTLPSGS